MYYILHLPSATVMYTWHYKFFTGEHIEMLLDNKNYKGVKFFPIKTDTKPEICRVFKRLKNYINCKIWIYNNIYDETKQPIIEHFEIIWRDE